MTTLVPLLLPAWMDPEFLINAMGNWALWGCALVIFAECGLFSILPGDSLLFTVGMFAALGSISFGGPMPTLIVSALVLTCAAIAGNVAGYWLGTVVGPPIFRPRDGLMGKVLDPRHVARTHAFFDRHGPKALILARFVPIVRTIVTLVAGVAGMPFRRFISYTAIGGALWGVGVTTLGYFLGRVDLIRDHIDAVLVLIVLVSLVPMGLEFALQRLKARKGELEGAAA